MNRDQDLLEAIKGLPDPEIPVITLGDLGVVRGIEREAGQCVVSITPTYSGCPATESIREDILALLKREGENDASVVMRYAPAWTTDWISEEGRRKLEAYGIAPPLACSSVTTRSSTVFPLHDRRKDPAIRCPRCHATQLERISEFGSTPCKALYRCLQCLEPFDYFKPY